MSGQGRYNGTLASLGVDLDGPLPDMYLIEQQVPLSAGFVLLASVIVLFMQLGCVRCEARRARPPARGEGERVLQPKPASHPTAANAASSARRGTARASADEVSPATPPPSLAAALRSGRRASRARATRRTSSSRTSSSLP